MTWWTAAEQRRQQLQAQFDSQQPREERNRLGQFATPFKLARQIVTVAQSYHPSGPEKRRFLEPAIGSGVFYSAFLDTTQGVLPQVAVGFEVNQRLVELAQQLWWSAGLTLHHADFTGVTPPADESERFDFLVTNPPYVRHHHLSLQQKQRLGNLVAKWSHLKPSGLMGLYGYFLLLSHEWLQQDGIGAWLIPGEFMDVGYGAVLRQYLTSEVELLHVHRFEAEDVQFVDADVTSTVVILRKRRPARGHEAVVSVGPDLEHPRNTFSVSVEELRHTHKWSAIARASRHTGSRRVRPSEHSITLGDLFDVRRGVATGANEFFIMTRDEAGGRGIPDTFLRPVLPSPRHLRDRRIIEADEKGYPKVRPALVLLDCSLPKTELADRYPDLYRYLLDGEKMGLHLRYLASHRDPWYRQEERLPAPLLCGYMGRRGQDGKSIRFYRNKSRAIATNVYLMLYPRPDLLLYCSDPEDLLDRVFQLLLDLDDDVVVDHGRTYGGGLNKIEPQELQRVAVPLGDEIESLAWLPRQQRLFEKLNRQ